MSPASLLWLEGTPPLAAQPLLVAFGGDRGEAPPANMLA
jgi:hypothetical protein